MVADWRRTLTILTTISILLFACSRDEPPADPGPTVTAETAEAPRPRLDPEELSPVIREVGPAGAGPTKIVVELAQKVVDQAQVGERLGDGTRFRVNPEVDGEIRFTSPSTLTFTPTTGFAPSSRYEVELVSLETRDGVLEAPSPGRWVRVLETPDFGFVRFALGEVDYAKKRASMDLVFSAPVDPAEVGRRAHLTVVAPSGGATAQPKTRFERGDNAHIVRAALSSSAIVPGGRVELALRQGIPSAADPERATRAMEAAVDLEVGPEVRVLKAYRAEGGGGHYVQVVCDDTAVDSRRWFWDRVDSESYGRISTRCLLDEDDAAAGIRFDPPVDFSIAAAGGGFRIFGDFERGSYSLRLDAGLRTVDGGMIHSARDVDFTVPARSPQIHFVSKGRYLPRAGWKSIPVRHLNLTTATLTVRHVPAENLVFWMSDDDESADARTSDLILEEQIPLRGETDVETTTYVDLGARVPADTKGLLEVRLAAGGARDTARILLTDLHLVAKRAGPEPQSNEAADLRSVHVWALDMETVTPLAGVDVQLVRKSGYELDACTTRGNGGCRLQPLENEVDPSRPFAIIARRGSDLTYLKFDELEAEVQEARISGEPYRGEKKYRAAIYSDRGVYRPGETAHLAAIVREQSNLAPEEGMPVLAKLIDPQGKVIQKRSLPVNGAGVVDTDFDFPAFAKTGRYEMQLAVANRQIGQYRFQVEEFVPERMKVEVAAADSEYRLGEEIRLDVSSRYLFGGVPANHRVEIRCELRPGIFTPPENSNFHYGVWRPEDQPVRPLELGTATAELDENGAGTFACPDAGGRPSFRGPAKLVADAAVFESGSGRTTVGRTEAPIHPESFYVGLQTGSTKVEVGNDLVVEGVVVDWQGRAQNEVETVNVELFRLDSEYGWYFDEERGYETYRRYRRPVREKAVEATVSDGKFRVVYRPENTGEAFLVRASAGDARTELELEGGGYWYYWAPRETAVDQTPRPGRPTWLALNVPDQVTVGERFPVQFKAPYRGRVLLTAETDEILRSEWLEVEAGDTVWFYELEDFAPNVYLTAFLVKDPHLDSPQAFLPDRAFGVQSARVAPVEFRHDLKLDTPPEVRSSSTLTVSLDLGKNRDAEGPTYATVAAVDEGILSLTRFESPDPFDAIFTRRALGVETFETVGWTLLVPPAGPTDVTGGDAAGDLGRVQPVKPVALWSGLVEVPKSGKVDVSFDLPQYRGELRVMAVTAGRKRMGRADASVTVRDPLVVQSTLPRFLTRGDDLRIPVQITNLSGTRRDIEVELDSEALDVPGLELPPEAGSPVEIVGARRQTLSLDHGEGGTAVFRARALAPTGAAHMTVTAKSGDLTSVEETDVPLLPAGPKSRVRQRIELEEGISDLTQHLDGWVALSERSTLWVTTNPYGESFDHLKYLVRYPYGCIEQTVSTTRPLLFLGNFINEVDPTILEEGTIEDRVMRGVERLLSMQTPAGGFAYWPGGLQPVHWGTANATHLLIDAQKLGYPVPQERIDEAVSWLERQISAFYEAGRDDWYGRGAEPYVHYVLAMAGRGRKARIEKVLAQLPEHSRRSDRENRFMLQAALHMAGDHRYESQLKNPDVSPITDFRRNGWSFYSDRRMRGFMLSTFVDLFGRDAAGESLANLVAESIRGRRSGWYTTQELVWSLTGLGKYLESGASDFEPPILRANGRKITPQFQERNTSSRTWSLARASEYDELTLEVPKKGDGELYLILSSEGVREVPDWRTGGEGLQLARRYLDAAGNPTGGAYKLGDLIYIELTVKNTSPDRIANIALVDRVPAGWEIENPRLGRDGSVGWINQQTLWNADHMDLRDDRLEIFGHLERNEARQVVYAVRAVTAGTFTVPPVEAEAMYDPRIWAREGLGEVTIAGPWEAINLASGSSPSSTVYGGEAGAAK